MRKLVLVFIAAASLFAAAPVPAQVVMTPHEREVARCVSEEKHRDRLALQRYGQRTRDDATIADFCRADVARRFDDRVLGRAPQPGLPPIIPPVARDVWAPQGSDWGSSGNRLVIQGSWHHVGIETTADNRFAYFIETKTAEHGAVAEAWLVSVYERRYPDGAASTAYRVRVDCAAGQWRYRYVAIRDAGFTVLRTQAVQANWQSANLKPLSPIARVRAMLCEDASPGEPLPRQMPAPGDWARNWFQRNPR